MKNSKQDITLNERDSIEDMILFQRGLLRDYAAAVFAAERKETRTLFLECLQEIAEDIWFLRDILETKEQERAIKN